MNIKIIGRPDNRIRELYRVALGESRRRQGGLAGQAFTNFTCLECGQEWSHPNTNTPLFCNPCEKDLIEWVKSETK